MKCSKCNVEPIIKNVTPKMIEKKPYTVQILACNNPNCLDYQKEIGELRHDFLEPNNPVIEVKYPNN